jgi:hypothetical protein
MPENKASSFRSNSPGAAEITPQESSSTEYLIHGSWNNFQGDAYRGKPGCKKLNGISHLKWFENGTVFAAAMRTSSKILRWRNHDN